mgnify:CR=1 FL=1
MFFLLKILSYAYFFLRCRADRVVRPYSTNCLLDVVAGELLTEGGGGAVLVLGLIEHGNSCVQRGADDQILLPGDLVGGVSLALGAGAEAHAGDAVAALDGHAVGGEGPLVGEGTALPQVHGVPLLVRVGMADTLVTPQGMVGVHQRLDMGGALLVDPGGEEALRLIDLAGPGGPVIHVHADLHIVSVLLDGGQLPDLLQAGVPGLAGGHAAVDGDGAAVGHGAAGGRGVEDLAGGAGATAQELSVLGVLRVEFRIQHFHEPLDLIGGAVAVFIEGADVLDDVRHLVNGIVAFFSGSMSGFSGKWIL